MNHSYAQERYVLPAEEFSPAWYVGNTPQERGCSLVRGLNEKAATLPRFSDERDSFVQRIGNVLRWLPPQVAQEQIDFLLDNGVLDIGEAIALDGKIPATEEQRSRAAKRDSEMFMEARILRVLADKKSPQWITDLFYRLLAHSSFSDRTCFDQAVNALTQSGDIRPVQGRSGLGIEISSERARAEGRRYREMHPAPIWTADTILIFGEELALQVRNTQVVEWIKDMISVPLTKELFAYFDDGWDDCSSDLMRWHLNGLVKDGRATMCTGADGVPEVSL
ncbi:MAG: hypothetical protein ABI759_10865 [Candidatus Solibacter sp.]